MTNTFNRPTRHRAFALAFRSMALLLFFLTMWQFGKQEGAAAAAVVLLAIFLCIMLLLVAAVHDLVAATLRTKISFSDNGKMIVIERPQ